MPPERWAGMGRAVNNITAAIIANASLALLASGVGMITIIIALLLFVAVSIVAVAYTSQRKTIVEESIVSAVNDL